jgi:hypothetical protein
MAPVGTTWTGSSCVQVLLLVPQQINPVGIFVYYLARVTAVDNKTASFLTKSKYWTRCCHTTLSVASRLNR